MFKIVEASSCNWRHVHNNEFIYLYNITGLAHWDNPLSSSSTFPLELLDNNILNTGIQYSMSVWPSGNPQISKNLHLVGFDIWECEY